MPLKVLLTLFPTFIVVLCGLLLLTPASAQQRPLQVTDIMKFRQIVQPQLSDNGLWLAYSAMPDRGDSTFYVQSIAGDVTYETNFGSMGVFSADGKYIAITVVPDLLSTEKADKKQKEKLKNSLEIIELASSKRMTYKNVKSFDLSDEHGYLAFLSGNIKTDEDDKEKDSAKAVEETDDEVKLFNEKRINSNLTLVNLMNFDEQQIDNVDSFAFSPKKATLVYSVSSEQGEKNALKVIDLNEAKTTTIIAQALASFNNFSWNEAGTKLAFTQGDFSEKTMIRQHDLKIWQQKRNNVHTVKMTNKQMFVSDTNTLGWSKDDERLFFGVKVVMAIPQKIETKPETQDDLYNLEKITEGRNLQIWHGNDALIKTNEKKQLDDDKKQFFTAVYHVDSKDFIQLANSEIINVEATDNEHAAIASSDLKYRKLRTWEGFFSDFYIVDLDSGKKSLIAEKLMTSNAVSLSESGRYAAYYKDENIWLFDRRKDNNTNLTQNLTVSFANEDHDRPDKAGGYGIAGWLEDDEGVLVYDKYDVWLLALDGKNNQCLTCDTGRPNTLQFRIKVLDEEQTYFTDKQRLLLSSYNHEFKNFGFYEFDLQSKKLTKLLEDNKKYTFIGKAKNSEKLLYSREDFNEFPDLWVSDLNPANGKKLSNVNPQKEDFLWGEPELIEWQSTMGKKLQGVLIKPANYIEGVQYPVVVYYYRLFSQRMYAFNAMKVNHRPNFPFYTSNGYAVFLPDVHFEIGRPGPSTNKSILPGIQKIIDMGIADKDAIGLHGHSWSGYQTLFSITETDMFAAAVSGAPVSNMTSAYSGIRLGSGLARQFQYEKGQSRIGASLFERRDLYIENSPVFYVDRINTPLLMQFGDIDDAVPWQQGVEMYMAMRRLDKEVILLQYEGEPHHLKKYPNKVDYTIKMKQYFDHYLKGAPAAKWMVEGEVYRDIEKD
jgi:dipeptidyl aminopeptidase/acylaminoacyl peptidase